jgi:hypothetical protein
MNHITVRSLLVRGMIAGVVAGLLAFGLAYLIGEPHVEDAIALEGQHTHGAAAATHAHEVEVELVTRPVQSTLGLATAVLVYGVALGGIAAIVFSFALGRVGRFSPRATAALVAGAAFVTVSLVPFLKYPANPPAVGDPGTVDQRTILYVLMIVLSMLLGLGSIWLGRRLAARLGAWDASLAAVAVFALTVGAAFVFLPAVDEVKSDFPADLLWGFRLSSLAIQALLWTAFGVVFGRLAQRVLNPGPSREGVIPPSAAPVG